jgi:MFS family permease
MLCSPLTSQVYSVAYGFNTLGVGLAALPFLIGTVVGEPVAGPFSDWVTRYMARRNGGIRHPEHRLQALWFGIPLIPVSQFSTVCKTSANETRPDLSFLVCAFSITPIG